MEKELITVIVPVYNVEKYLGKCIESIIEQTYKNLEIILVDDGSPDNCPFICDLYAQKDKRVRVIHKTNGGLSDARNEGLNAANGEYVAFIDSDDYIHVNMIEKLYCAIKAYDADVSLCNYLYVDENYHSIDELNRITPIKNEVLSCEQVIEKLFENKHWYYSVAWNKLYKRGIFDKLQFPKGRLFEDAYIAHHVFGKCKRIVSISDVLYFYLQRADSIMGYFRNNTFFIEQDLIKCDFYLDRMHYLQSIHLERYAAKAYERAIMLYYEICLSPSEETKRKECNVITSIKYEVRKNFSISKYLGIKKRIKLFMICISPQVYKTYNRIVYRRKKN